MLQLDIRPAYQREFVYKDAQRDAVVHTVRNGYPLNTMYWAVRGDGFPTLQGDEQQQILDYEVDVYQCTGSDSEKFAWF